MFFAWLQGRSSNHRDFKKSSSKVHVFKYLCLEVIGSRPTILLLLSLSWCICPDTLSGLESGCSMHALHRQVTSSSLLLESVSLSNHRPKRHVVADKRFLTEKSAEEAGKVRGRCTSRNDTCHIVPHPFDCFSHLISVTACTLCALSIPSTINGRWILATSRVDIGTMVSLLRKTIY